MSSGVREEMVRGSFFTVMLGLLSCVLIFDEAMAQPNNSFSPTTISRTVKEPHGFMFFGKGSPQPYFERINSENSFEFDTKHSWLRRDFYNGGRVLKNHQVMVYQWNAGWKVNKVILNSTGLFTSCNCGDRVYSSNFLGIEAGKKMAIGALINQNNSNVMPGIAGQMNYKKFQMGLSITIDPTRANTPQVMGVINVPF